VRTAVSKNGGNLGAPGSVSHAFDRMGLINYPASAGDAEKVFEAALEAGAEDVDLERGRPRDLDRAGRSARSRQGARAGARRAEGAKLAWRPQTMVAVDEGDAGTAVQADRRARRR
jgi:transcriptional/translational regulatory protein YebC/TACO1